MDRTRLKISLVCNVFTAVMVAVAWCMMAFGSGLEMLAARGLWSLKYFTVLSNILLGIASLLYAVAILRKLHNGTKIPRPIHTLNYIATCAVTLTFLTVVCFLGPVFGFTIMFVGANLWFHLILPLLAIAECCSIDNEWPLTLKHTFLALLPVAIYGAFYLGNILINGVGEPPFSNDWYGFTMWGIDKIWIVYIVMALVSWLIALVIRALNMKIAYRFHMQDGKR